MPLRVEQPNRLQHARHADGGEFAGQDRLLPARRHEAHGREVVDLLGAHRPKHIDDRQLVEQVGLMEGDAAGQVGDAFEGLGAGAADDAVDLVAFFQQQLGEVAAVLAGDARDDRFLMVSFVLLAS